MRVVLLQEVKKLGKVGTMKEVRNGYGFNFLLPKGLAELATPQAVKRAQSMIAKQAKAEEAEQAKWKGIAATLEGKQVTIKVKAKDGKLFGSVSGEEIVAALKEAGVEVDAKIIVIEKPFKEIGTFPVEAHFGHDVKASFVVVIEAE